MLKALKQLWHKISVIGIHEEFQLSIDDIKRRTFFNRSLTIGVISMLAEVSRSYTFIGNYSLLNLVSVATILFGLYLHAKGYFEIAKRLVIYTIFIMGGILTSLAGGDYLYHTGVITVLTFSWILYDTTKERVELFLLFMAAIAVYVIGEFNLFQAPDFSNHPDTPSARILSLIAYTFLVIIFINFIRRLNASNEIQLSRVIQEKDALLSDVIVKSKELEIERARLENVVDERTAELEAQKDVLIIQNKEKEVLLKEIHHRVKNNLQIIVSLLNLQSANFQDKKTLTAFRETQNRVISMSLVHQRMYQTANFVGIELGDYIELLIKNNKMLYSEHKKKVSYSSNCEKVKLNIDTAIPMGLIINELITNSFKYAFLIPENEHQITIEGKNISDTEYSLVYRDNGPGLPEGFDVENASTLGIQLIDALVGQVNGELTCFNQEGAVFEINFSL